MLTEYLKLFNFYCKMIGVFNCSFLKWDPNLKEMSHIKRSRAAQQQYWRPMYINTLCLAVICLQGVPVLQPKVVRESLSYTNKFVYAFAVSHLGCFYFAFPTAYRHTEAICCYFNNLFRFDVQYPAAPDETPKKMSFIHFLHLSFTACIIITVSFFPVAFTYVLHWNEPCKPSLPLYWLLPECHGVEYGKSAWTSEWILIRILRTFIFVNNHILWLRGLLISSYVINTIQLMCILTLKDFINRFRGYSLGRTSNTLESVRMYRKIQVLAVIMNEIQKGWMMTVIVFCLSFFQSVCLTAALLLMPTANENWATMVAFGLCYHNCTVCHIIMLGAMASIYSDSCQAFLIMKANFNEVVKMRGCRGIEARWIQRFLRTTPLIKVIFGFNNFVDSETPINCINTSNDLTVNFMLLETN